MRRLCLVTLSFALTAMAEYRYVSKTGSDTGDCTNIDYPCLTLQYATNQVSPGDTVFVRTGRYTTTAGAFVFPTVSGTPQNPITIAGYPGEAVEFDCEFVSGRRFANFTTNNIGYYVFASLTVINVHSSYGPLLVQNTHPSVVLKGVRFYSSGFGVGYNPVANQDGHKILGSYIQNGVGTSFDCSSWSGPNNGDYSGCTNFIIQDSVFSRTGMGSDNIGGEAGHHFLFERVLVESLTRDTRDCFDLKANYVFLFDVKVFGCDAKGITTWGYNTRVHTLTDGHSDLLGEYSGRDVDNAVDENGFIKVTATYDPYGGQVPIIGHRVLIENVQGCTGANGVWRIKDAVNKDTFRIMGDNGESTSCGGTFVYSSAGKVRLAGPLAKDKEYATDTKFATMAVGGGFAATVMYRGDSDTVKWRLTDSIVSSAAASGSTAICTDPTPVRTSDRNQLYSGRGQLYAISYNAGEACPSYDGNLLSTYEPNSHFGNPNLAAVTFRATASSPSTLVNRGYYAGWNTATGGETRMLVRFRAPEALDQCTVVLDDTSDFSSPVETIISQPGQMWRDVVFGLSTPLNTSTVYYHKITCGYDVSTGSASTMASTAGTSSLKVSLGPAADGSAPNAALDISSDGGSTWTPGTAVSCSSGCSLSASVDRGQIYYTRTRRETGGGATVYTSEPQPVRIP